MISLILQGIRDLGFDRVRLYLLSDQGKGLKLVNHSGMEDSFIGTEWSLTDTHFDNLFKVRFPRVFNTANGDSPTELPLNDDQAHEWAGVGLWTANELKGLITADNKHTDTRITEEMLSKLQGFAERAVEAIESAEELRNVRLRAAQLETLDRTAVEITSNLANGAPFKMIIQSAMHLLQAESGGIYEYHPERGELVLLAEHNRQEHVGKILRKGDGVAGRLVIDDNDTLEEWDTTAARLEDGTIYRVVDNYNEWPGRAGIYASARAFVAVLAVQLKWRERIIGVLYVDAHKGRRFTKEDAHLLKRFADHAAIAMVHAELVGSNELKLKKLARLSEIMKELMGDLGTKDLDSRLNQVAMYAAQMVEAEVCGVFLVKESDVLTLEASFGHREGSFQKGKRFEIKTGIGTGLTGHIAAKGELFNSSGEELLQHPAVRGAEPDCSPSFVCTSLLAIPLKNKKNGADKLVGLIRVGNKLDRNGRAQPPLQFSKEDEWILTIFAETVVTAIEGAVLVTELTSQKDKLSGMVISSPSGIIATDKTGRITEFNDKARSILRYGPGDPDPTCVTEVYLSEKDARSVGSHLHRNDGKLEKFEIEIRARDGSLVPVQLSATWLYDEHGNRSGSVGYFEDLRPIIAVEKRLELFLEANRIVATANSPTAGLQNLAEKLISLLNHSFCRILLLDESGQHLIVEAAYPITRSRGEFEWSPRRNDRVALSDYEGLDKFLEKGKARVVRLSEESCRPMLEKFSERIGLKEPVQALLIVPLRLDKKVVGLLDIGEVRTETAKSGIPGSEESLDSERRSDPLSHTFNDEKVEMVTSVAAQTSFLIERIKLFEIAERRRKLLERLDEKARELISLKEIDKVRREAIVYAIDLLDGRDTMAGVLFENYRLPEKLEPLTSFQLPLPTDQFSHSDGILGKVARTGQSAVATPYSAYTECESVFPSSEFRSMVAIPLHQDGDVTYVLALADRSSTLNFGNAELEILERFAAQASIALETATLMSPERRTFHHLKVLHQITEVVLSEQDLNKVLHAVLTGITAGYGLGFNRAALLLLDETGETLKGAQGIGHVDQKKAEEDWNRYHANKLDTFQSYIEYSNNNPISMTPIGEWVKQYSLSIDDKSATPFRLAVKEKKWSLVLQTELKELPRDFLYGFSPMTDMVIVPLHTREKPVGVIVADNKFSKASISEEDVESLMTYSNNAALAIDNLRLKKRVEADREEMQNLFKAGTSLQTISDPQQMLNDIVSLTHESAEAAWVRIILIDELEQPRFLISKGTDCEPSLQDVFRPDGISQEVMRSGKAIKIENTFRSQLNLNPVLRRDYPQALVCLPLALQGRKLGVIWIGYSAPRVLHDTFIKSLQLYVNQAAIAYDSAHRMEELEQMRYAAEALAASDDPQDVLDKILKRTRTALRADSAAIWPYDDVRNVFLKDGWVSYNIPTELRNDFWKETPRFGGTADTVKKAGLITVDNIGDNSYQFLGQATRRLLRRIGVQSFIGISLAVGQEKLGVLYVNYNRPRNFSEEEKETARTFANNAAMALKRAKLFDQLQKAKTAAEAVARVTALGDHIQTLDEIVKDTADALDCQAVVLFIYDRAEDKLRHPPYMHGVRDRHAAAAYQEVERHSLVYKILKRDHAEFIEYADKAPLTADSRFRKDEGIKSLVGIPLRASDEKVGVMFINYHFTHHFTPEERENIEFFANLAAAAIRNAKLFEKRLLEQNQYLKLSRQLLATVDVRDRMRVGVASAAEMLQAEFCAIVLTEEDSDELIFSAGHGWDEEDIKELRPKTYPQISYSIKHRKAIIVDDFESEKRFDVHPLVKKRGLHSSVSVPMFDGDKIIAVIIVHARPVGHFGSYEANLITLIANQLSVALQSAEKIKRKQRSLDALYEASKAIAASFRLNPDRVIYEYNPVLDEIIKHAVEGITERKATLGMIKLYDETTNELTCESVYPPEKRPELIAKIAERKSSNGNGSSETRVGVVGMAIKSRTTQLIPDVDKCDFYVKQEESTRSELATPLIIDGRVRGVINLESDRVNGFDDSDKRNLEALAEMVVVVFKNAELFNELIETKSISDSNKQLARMGMIHGVWGHAIEGHAINIKNLPTLMRSEIFNWGLTDEQMAKLEERFTFLESMSEKILRKDALPPLAYSETIDLISVDDLINDRVTDLWRNEPYRRCNFPELHLAAMDSKVRVNSLWLRHALDILVDNAVKAMTGSELQKLTISTSQKKGDVEILVSDTGRGIPKEKRQNLLKHPLPVRPGEKGLGVGLLFARLIIETYNGNLTLKETGSRGTTFVITLPSAE